MWQWLVYDFVPDTTSWKKHFQCGQKHCSGDLALSTLAAEQSDRPGREFSLAADCNTAQSSASQSQPAPHTHKSSLSMAILGTPIQAGHEAERCSWRQRQLQQLLVFFQLNSVGSCGEASDLWFLWKCTGWRSHHCLFKGRVIPLLILHIKL